jgi:hypothetical protein
VSSAYLHAPDAAGHLLDARARISLRRIEAFLLEAERDTALIIFTTIDEFEASDACEAAVIDIRGGAFTWLADGSRRRADLGRS